MESPVEFLPAAYVEGELSYSNAEPYENDYPEGTDEHDQFKRGYKDAENAEFILINEPVVEENWIDKLNTKEFDSHWPDY